MSLTRIECSDGSFRYFKFDKEVSEAEYNASLPPLSKKSQSLIGWKPIVSEALAVHPDQIPEVMERNRKHGINVHYDSEGRPTLPTREVRKRLMKLEGQFDRNAGYGDHTK